jgi:hypothetical protein
MGFGVEKHDDLMDALTIAVNEIMKQNEPYCAYFQIEDSPSIVGNIWNEKF